MCPTSRRSRYVPDEWQPTQNSGFDGYRENQSAQPSDDLSQTLDASELGTLTQAEKNARKRQQVLGERVVMKLAADDSADHGPSLCSLHLILSAAYRSSASSTGPSLPWSGLSTLRTFHTCSNGPIFCCCVIRRLYRATRPSYAYTIAYGNMMNIPFLPLLH